MHSQRKSPLRPYLFYFLQFFLYRHIYIFKTSKLKHGKWHIQNVPFKDFIQQKLESEKDTFERHQNNTAIMVDYLT